MRALENGRFLVRATNTGISAIIDERGRVIATVPSFVRGGVDRRGPAASGRHALRPVPQLAGDRAGVGDGRRRAALGSGAAGSGTSS